MTIGHAPDGDVALVARLSRYLHLVPEERAAVAAAVGTPHRLAAGEVLQQEGRGPVDSLFAVEQGWLHSSTRLANGNRQILRFHYPGDLIGTSSIAWSVAAASLTAVSDCIVYDVPKDALGALFAASGRIGGLLFAMAAAENVALADRLTSIGRTDALTRLATLLLDVRARLRSTAGGVVNTIDLPLTQAELGDALGLSKVHVNRTLLDMEARGWIARNTRRITLTDEAAMVEATGFVDRYAELETDWLPDASSAPVRAMADT